MYLAGFTRTNRLTVAHRSKLVGQHIGETAIKTQAVIDAGAGGTILIDEAYNLVPEGSSKDFGPEAIETIMAEMEGGQTLEGSERPPVFIFAGYKDGLDRILDVNPGLSRRMAFKFDFQSYSIPELIEIMRKMASIEKIPIHPECSSVLLEEAISEKGITEGLLQNYNAGFSKMIFESSKLCRDVRLVKLFKNKQRDDLVTIRLCDIRKAIGKVVLVPRKE